MEDFPSNSKQAKKAQDVKEEEPKKVEKVVAGDVQRRKKPLGKRFSETFFGGDARSVASFVVLDVMIPAAKDMVADAVSQGVERTLFGEARSSSRRSASRYGSGSPLGHVDYRSASGGRAPRREEARVPSRRARAAHDFDEIIIPTRVEAEEVVDRMFDMLGRYDIVTVADLYDLVGITGDYTDEKWGWTELRGAGVRRVRNGYLLDLPRPEHIT